jgi:hypothetical protein
VVSDVEMEVQALHYKVQARSVQLDKVPSP